MATTRSRSSPLSSPSSFGSSTTPTFAACSMAPRARSASGKRNNMGLFREKTPKPATDAEKLAQLRLFRTENVGPVTYNRLMERYGSAQKALEAIPELSKRGGRLGELKPVSKDSAEKELEQ